MTLPTNTLPTLAGMPLDVDEVRILALSEECDRLREAFRRFGRHTSECRIAEEMHHINGRKSPFVCRCGFDAEWRRVFGPTTRSG